MAQSIAFKKPLPVSLRKLSVAVSGETDVGLCDSLDLAALRNIEDLTISLDHCPFPKSLPRSLRALGLSSTSILSLQELPPGLEILRLAAPNIVDMNDLPSSLRVFVHDACEPIVVKNWPVGLRELSLSGCRINSLPGEKSLTGLLSLNISSTAIESLPDLPKSLVRLDISNSRIVLKDLSGLPPALEELSVSQCQVASLKSRPAGLKSISIKAGLITC